MEPEVQRHTYNSPTLNPILCQINLIGILYSYLFKIYLIISHLRMPLHILSIQAFWILSPSVISRVQIVNLLYSQSDNVESHINQENNCLCSCDT
jgi:hypothetical protein